MDGEKAPGLWRKKQKPLSCSLYSCIRLLAKSRFRKRIKQISWKVYKLYWNMVGKSLISINIFLLHIWIGLDLLRHYKVKSNCIHQQPTHLSEDKGIFATNICGQTQPCLESIIISVTHILGSTFIWNSLSFLSWWKAL